MKGGSDRVKVLVAFGALLLITVLALVACHAPPPDAARSRPDCFVDWSPGCPRGLDDTREFSDCRWPGDPPSDAGPDLRPECKVASFEGGVMLFDGGILR